MPEYVNELRTPAAIPRRDRQPTAAALRSGITAFDLLATTAAPATPVDPRIVSSAHGALRHLLLCYPPYAEGDFTLEGTFAELFRKLPSGCALTVLAHPAVADDLRRIVDRDRRQNRPTVIESPDYLSFSVWAEDGYVAVTDVGTDPPRTFLVEPFSFPRYGDGLIADLVAEATDVQATQAPLYFQGGNVLVGDDFMVVGADYLTRTLETWQQSAPVLIGDGSPAKRAQELFVKTFDARRRLHFLGLARPIPEELLAPRRFRRDGEWWTEDVGAGAGSLQPIFHIDMFLSLAGRNPESGRYRVLVGSPASAAELLEERLPDHALALAFDEIARRLKRLGFEVVRTPLPRVYVDYPDERLRQWYFATSNNCLVEITESSRRVWLPTYGHGPWTALRATDEANKRIWEGLGFDVVQLGDFHYFAQNLGSLHCIKKYLERGPG
ncbi:MAG TPA: hypothetical protein VHG90_10635, partial [Acidimicrobiales bacterium]|nr:hypothetical protein [Acidimicrobiales bacterium]